VTAEELSEHFGVSTRTIYRDIDELSSAGVLIFANLGNKSGISLLDCFAINCAMLNEHERDSLILALKTLQASRYPEIDDILDKIGAVFKSAADDTLFSGSFVKISTV
jgi:predicted DNA-binding transcriptional regulator YafY